MTLALGRAGAAVAGVSQTSAELEDVSSTISRIHQIPAITLIADAADPQTPQRAVEELVARLGHNNAGIDKFNTLEHEASIQSWWRVMEVNLRGLRPSPTQCCPECSRASEGP